MVEEPLVKSLGMYVELGSENERQLAQLAIDLIQIAGDQPGVISYINRMAAQAIDEERPWP